MMIRIISLVLALLVGVAAYSGYRLLLAGIEVDVYRERLVELRRDHDQLRKQYNQAVRRTAVTELLVNDGKLRVSIRTAEGELRTLETPYDPSREIYVDYVIIDGRLWIRRVFDANTAPGQGMVIDPALVDIDWDVARAAHGKAAYRPLDEGRWVVTVTGDGSLGLARVDAARVELSGPPAVREYAPVGESVDAVLRELTVAEMLRSLARRLSLVPLLSDS